MQLKDEKSIMRDRVLCVSSVSIESYLNFIFQMVGPWRLNNFENHSSIKEIIIDKL